MKTRLFITAIALLISTQAAAQGFNSTNGRNHPELKWQVAETEHFLIMYPKRIDGIQDQVAPIAEQTYSALSKNLEVEFNFKIRIYLTDEDEINNGFAVPFNRSYTAIWVHLNDYSEIWTGDEKWLRKVVAHELAHIFHFEAVKSNIGVLQYVFATPFTRFWTEGLAQYQTEKWDAQRGDRWLRKAIFDDDLNYNSGHSLENGKLLYALGNSQLRYFSDKYGDSTLVDLLKYRNKAIGLFEYHDFNEAFDETIAGGYRAFFDDWRKHMNVYYNTMASQMERVDSLHANDFSFPGNFYYDAAISPKDTLIAVLSLQSMSRPVRRLHLIKNDTTREVKQIGEGSINADLGWSKDGSKLLYSKLTRGERSSLLNDVFMYDVVSGEEKQVTFSRRAKFPTTGPADNEIAYVVNENGTGNLFLLDLNTNEERRITKYSGDIQLLWPLWIAREQKWLVHRFDAAGNRNLVLIDPENNTEVSLNDYSVDNRKAVLSPYGNKIAYTSLRDEVPNVFIYDLESMQETRYTNLFTGGEVFGWVSAVDTIKADHLLIGASESRSKDQLFFVETERKIDPKTIEIPKDYSRWKLHSPPNKIASKIEMDADLISSTYPYRSLKNLVHVTSFGLPYYENNNNWGVFATTNWLEPLGKHIILAGGWLSIPDIQNKSYGAIYYINNQLYPTLGFALYRIPENGQFYNDIFLSEESTGGDFSISWPLDLFERYYQKSKFMAKFRYYSTQPLEVQRLESTPTIKQPQSATVSNLELSWQIKKQYPWRDNVIHPLDGYGIKVSLKAADKILGTDVEAITADINSFVIIPTIGWHRILLRGRYQGQWGNALPQNYIGFSRYDNIYFNMPFDLPVRFFSDNERVRGYREFITGKQVAFGSFEYRIPLLPSLKTTILGIVKFGGVNLNVFTDGGIVWSGQSTSGETGTIYKWGAGAEIGNKLSLFGLNVSHSAGIAQPAEYLLSDQNINIYYRIRAVLPF
ncbi:MAG: BamA/TamA family outer membrane protein [Gracilimonas sp.]